MQQSSPARTSRFRFLAAMTVGVAILTLCCSQAKAAEPVKLAVFDFELEDFSAGGPIAGESPEETARLKLVTAEARKLLAQSGRYELVDASAVDPERLKEHWLRHCNGCEADIARQAGADQAFLGIVQKLSVLVHTIRFQIRDTRTGQVILNVQTDLRGDTDESWRRAVVWLIKNRLLANEQVGDNVHHR